MLVLTRRVGEEIVIGGNIRVTVLDAGVGRVRIGVTAPPDVRVDRQEIATRREIDLRRAVKALYSPPPRVRRVPATTGA